MKAASCSQRVGDIRPCAPGALQGPAQSQACCRSACGRGGGPSASSCFAEPVRTEAPGRPCPTLATPAGTRGPSGVSPGTSSVPAAPSTPPRWQSRPPAPSLTVHSGPATQQPRADVSWPQTAFSFWEAGETPGSQASPNTPHQSFWGKEGTAACLQQGLLPVTRPLTCSDSPGRSQAWGALWSLKSYEAEGSLQELSPAVPTQGSAHCPPRSPVSLEPHEPRPGPSLTPEALM